jgi:cell filamentation protein
MSRYNADDVYCILGTAVLKNKAGITNQNLLDEYEADFTAIRILELAHTPVEGNFDLAHLCKIHAYLFQDVYEWAGEIRSVDIIRGDSRFCNVRQIQAAIAKLSNDSSKKATDFKNQWLFNVVGPPGLEPGTKGL